MILPTNNLYIVSTPIGNLDDITLRAINVLKKSDIILCEDTRHSLKLLNHLKIKKKLISYHKFNERKQILRIIEHINQGKILSLISDAGTPTISDPGKLLINECIKKNIQLTPVPGVSSITAAMSVSGFSDQFLFYGFLPKTEKEVEKVFKLLSKNSFSQIFFVTSKKIDFYIKKIKQFYSGRKILIAKEISKIHESFFRDNVDNLQNFTNTLKGELTVVISEEIKKSNYYDKENIYQMLKKNLKKYSLKDTVDLISKMEKISKKELYKICLKIKNEKNN